MGRTTRRPIIDATTPYDAWSEFWRTSRQGAIDMHSDDPVADALRKHWLEQLPWLTACDTVVDVGSGPAVLARLLLARQTPPLGRMRWTCIDHARVPLGTDLPAAVRLLDGVDFGASSPPPGEALPSALVSNFGIEYVDHAALAAACARWLAPGGRLHAVVHASGSIIDQVSVVAADDIAWALDDVKLFDVAIALVLAMATLPADPIDRMMHGVDQRDAYNEAVNRLKQRMQARGAVSAPLIEMLNGLRLLATLALGGQGDAARAALSARRDALRGETLRLRAMQGCALDTDRVAALIQTFSVAGITMEPASRLDCALGTVAWVVVGCRA